MDYAAYIEQYVLAEGFDYAAAVERIEVTYLDGNITLGDRDRLLALADERANPDSDLPDVTERIQGVEERCAALESILIMHGWISSDTCPLVTGERFQSSDQKRHTGDRVSMLLEGEETIRRYICKLNPTWEPKGTVYTPLGNAGSWYEITGKTEEEITAYMAAWVNKFPDFDGWVRDDVRALIQPVSEVNT